MHVIRAVRVAVAVVGVWLGLASGPPASADVYDDFGVRVADRPFFDWLAKDGRYVLTPDSFKLAIKLGDSICGLVDRSQGSGSALKYMTTTPMPGQSRPMAPGEARWWLNGSVSNLCPELL